MLRNMQAHDAVVVAVDCSKGIRNALCRLWQKDLKSLGSMVPSGPPNSSSVGIIRSNGLPFGTFAAKARARAELRRCWRVFALALGRDDPFPAPVRGASQPAVISSFDGILYTKATDNFKYGTATGASVCAPAAARSSAARLRCGLLPGQSPQSLARLPARTRHTLVHIA